MRTGWRQGALRVAGFVGVLSYVLLVGCSPSGSAGGTMLSAAESVAVEAAAPEATSLQYQVHSLPNAVVHTLRIPRSYRVTVAVAPETASLAEFVQQSGAIAALNAGFFDPVNQQTTSYVVQQGQIVADPRQNERLMTNPDLAAYLNQILDRSEFRSYRCDSADPSTSRTLLYAIARRSAPLPVDCRLVDAVGAGPQLLPDLTAEAEGFVTTVDGTVVRDALGSNQPNARTAIGITRNGDLIWAMVAQLSGKPGSGLSLPDLAIFLNSLGVETALNLDGGSSSALFYNGQTLYGKVDGQGNPVMRPVKSVLLLQPAR